MERLHTAEMEQQPPVPSPFTRQALHRRRRRQAGKAVPSSRCHGSCEGSKTQHVLPTQRDQ